MKHLGVFLFFLITITTGGAQSMANTSGNDTKVKLIVNDTVLSATLNDSVSARDLISKLPYTVKVSRASVDYCGRLSEPLKSISSEGQSGWKDGDISYIPGADWIAFFMAGEESSESDGNHQHIIGRVDDLDALKAWPSGSIEVRIEK